ncbi:MAG: hypothetical protein H6673_06860 [Anaerolineales bacterium]|nr:hypothetical protein [Anaerolineales bacterium]
MSDSTLQRANDRLASHLHGTVLTANIVVPNRTQEYWGQDLPLPFLNDCYDWVVCNPTTSQASTWLREMARVAQHVAFWDIVASGHAKAEPYISAFERLRHPTRARVRSLRTWLALFEKTGLVVEHHYLIDEVVNLNQWALKTVPIFWKDETSLVLQRLQAMVVQAPAPVQDWLAPQLPLEGSGEAIQFTRHFALIIGRRA